MNMEQIRTTVSNRDGSISYWIADADRGVPYASVTVNVDGDYWLTLYGSFCFSRPAHAKLLAYAKPTGKNITADKYYANKR